MQYGEAVSVIRRIPIFAGLDKAAQKLIAFSSMYLEFEPGEVIFRAGDVTDCVYVIDEGVVEVISERDGEDVVVGKLDRHKLVGEMGIFRNAPRSATVRALDSVKALKIDADVFLRIVTENADAAVAVMRDLSDKVAALTELYEQSARQSDAMINHPPKTS